MNTKWQPMKLAAALAAVALVMSMACDPCEFNRVEVTNPPAKEADPKRTWTQIKVCVPLDGLDEFLQTFEVTLSDGDQCFVLTERSYAKLDTFPWAFYEDSSRRAINLVCLESPVINTAQEGSLLFRFSITKDTGDTLMWDSMKVSLTDDVYHKFEFIPYHADRAVMQLCWGCQVSREYSMPQPFPSSDSTSWYLFRASNSIRNPKIY